jgi:hypothetical protein
MSKPTDTAQHLLRHTLATLAYRCGKVVRGAPADFSDFRAGDSSRSAGQIFAHIGDLLDWALHLCKGERVWKNSTPLPWEEETARFFEALKRLDAYLASDAPLACSSEKLFQGPIADALSHTGQIALLRRLAGSPVRGENYFVADIAAGRVGAEQAAAKLEFD